MSLILVKMFLVIVLKELCFFIPQRPQQSGSISITLMNKIENDSTKLFYLPDTKYHIDTLKKLTISENKFLEQS